MFYPSDILKKRGKFGLIWLAATKAKKLHRRQICSVNVVEASEDIMNVLNTHILTGIRRKIYFSLYLSAQLVGGLVYIADMQTRILLEDMKTIVLRLKDSKASTIDLNKTLSKAKVTLEELDMNDVPLDFGSFNPPPDPSDHVIAYEYFLITTPKSSDASSPQSFDHRKSVFELPREEENSFHLARREDITLTDAVPFQSEEPIPELDEAVDLLVPPLPFIPPTTQPEGIQPFDFGVIPFPYGNENPIFLTPDVDDEELPAEQHRDISLGQTPELPPERRAASEVSDGFILPPTVPDQKRRKKKRHLLVDAVTSLTGDQIKKSIASANSNLTVPLAIPSTLESAKSLMTRLGSGFLAPKGVLERLKRLNTLPQLEEGEVSTEERDELTSPVRRRISGSESVEEERAVLDNTKDPSRSGLLKSASIRTLEASSTLSIPVRPEEVAGPSSPMQFPGEEDHENLHYKSAPDIESPSMPFVDVESIRKECMISPERTPPPPSPPPFHQILNEAFELILETAAHSVVLNITTFSAMLENTDAARKRVASLFNSLLCLHAEGKIIVQQPVTWGEIFIEIVRSDCSS